jgi:hypothetical protein
MSLSLKPCPFCGSPARLSDEIISPRGRAAGEHASFDIECTGCWAYNRCETREEAVASWTTRAEATEAQARRIGELEAILRPVANLYGMKAPHVVIGRTVRDAHFALLPADTKEGEG